MIDGAEHGLGWTHMYKVATGIGGCLQTKIQGGKGRIKFALALPYLGFGDHGGQPVWAPWLGPTHADDDRHWWLDDISIVTDTGTQTVGGAKTFSDDVTIATELDIRGSTANNALMQTWGASGGSGGYSTLQLWCALLK